MPFTSLIPPTKGTRPTAAYFGPAKGYPVLRDSFTIQTWLALGALLQTTAYLLLGRLTLLPAFLYLLYSALDTYAISVGFKSNPYLAGVISQKFSAQPPNPDGTPAEKPSGTDVVVLLIGTRMNHPLGILAPGAKQLGAYFQSMTRTLDTHAEDFGFLGMTSWIGAADRQSKNELMNVAYFRSIEGLHAFAHSRYHREGWEWWNTTAKEHPHLSIYHEIYHAPRGCWESIYAHSHPTGLAGTTFKVQGTEEWVSPVVDASRGVLAGSAGRLGMKGGAKGEKELEVSPH